MAFSHGSKAVLKIHDGTSLRDVTAYLTSTGLPADRDMAETSVLSNVDKQFIPGLTGRTIPLEGNGDPTVDGYLSTLLGDSTARAFEYYPAGEPVGATKPKYSGNYFLASYESSTPVDAPWTFSAELQVTGAVTRAVA